MQAGKQFFRIAEIQRETDRGGERSRELELEYRYPYVFNQAFEDEMHLKKLYSTSSLRLRLRRFCANCGPCRFPMPKSLVKGSYPPEKSRLMINPATTLQKLLICKQLSDFFHYVHKAVNQGLLLNGDETKVFTGTLWPERYAIPYEYFDPPQ